MGRYKKLLENFLGDEVIDHGIFYEWKGIYYEVLPWSKLLKDKKRKASHFIGYNYWGVKYAIRELTPELVHKFYGVNVKQEKLI